MPSIIRCLFERERGAKISNQLESLAQILGEEHIIGHFKAPKSVDNIPDSSRSAFAIEFSHDGTLAAVSHTNRTVSLIKVATMNKIGEIRLDQTSRTVWTMEFHPCDKSILALGTLSGRVSIYKNCDLYRTFQQLMVLPITSLTFHSLNFYLCFAYENQLYLWDWEADRLIGKPLQCTLQERIRFIKFNPLNCTLITGITKLPSLDLSIYTQRTARFSTLYLLDTFLNTVHFLLEHLESFACVTSCMDQVETKPHIWNYVIKFLIAHQQRHRQNPVILPTTVDDYQLCNLRSSIDLFTRRINALVAKSSTFEFDMHRLKSYAAQIDGVMDFFAAINDRVLSDPQNAGHFVRVQMDERKIAEIIKIMYGLMYTFNKDDVITCSLEDYVADSEFASEISLSIPTEKRKQFNLQVWDLDADQDVMPRLTNSWSNIITTCCIHNDSTIALSACGTRIATFKAECFTKIIEIRSLEEHNLGTLLHHYAIDRPFVSLTFSPTGQHLLLGVRLLHHCGTILQMTPGEQKMTIVRRLDDNDHQSDHQINCAKWAPNACDGILVGHKNHCLRYVNFKCKVQYTNRNRLAE